MRKILLGLAATATAVAALGLAGARTPTSRPTAPTKDAQGYCIANHIANFNGDDHGIGHLRSQMTGTQIAGQSGNNPPSPPCVDTQGDFAPISDND